MANDPPIDLVLTPINGPGRTVGEWLTTFHLVFVAVDPWSRESTARLPELTRILLNFQEADCRVAWLATADPDRCRLVLGRAAQEILTFSDPEQVALKAFGIERIPALVHLGLDGSVIGAAEGWDPVTWRGVTTRLAKMMAWLPPTIPLR